MPDIVSTQSAYIALLKDIKDIVRDIRENAELIVDSTERTTEILGIAHGFPLPRGSIK